MKSYLKKIALGFALLFSFMIISDAYVCEDSSPKQASSHCCIQCCPAHHLVPPTKMLSSIVEPGTPKLFIAPDFRMHYFLLIMPVFHPPKTSLS